MPLLLRQDLPIRRPKHPPELMGEDLCNVNSLVIKMNGMNDMRVDDHIEDLVQSKQPDESVSTAFFMNT